MNFVKFLRTSFLTEQLRWLLLHFDKGLNSDKILPPSPEKQIKAITIQNSVQN